MSSKVINLEPLSDRVVIEPIDAESVTPGGIVLPDIVQEKSQRGTVLAAGPGKMLGDGVFVEMSLKVGDVVIYRPYVGCSVKVDGCEIEILCESDILAKVL